MDRRKFGVAGARVKYHSLDVSPGAGPPRGRPLDGRNQPTTTYRDAGVDIDAGDELVERIKPAVKRSMRPEVLGGLGGFGALVEVPLDRYRAR